VPEDFLLEVPPAGEGFWELFDVLQGERTYSGMTAIPNGFPVGAIRAEARARGLDEDEAVQVMRQLDGVWREHEMRRLTPKRKAKAKTRRPAAPADLGVVLDVAEEPSSE
jgi:hypothetical protein